MFAIPETFSPLLSLGIGLVNSQLLDSSELATRIPSYEVFAQVYASLPEENFYLRPAVRFSYEPESNVELPTSLSLREQTIKAAAELGLLYNGIIVPAVTLQGAMLSRNLRLYTADPVIASSANSLSRRETLWQAAVTAGVGFPFADGSLVVEPFYRLMQIQDDNRQSTQWGCDVSYALPVFSPAN
ncbi:MAG: hypothetical protein RL189_1693 [Pseudomonadota bacterium]